MSLFNDIGFKFGDLVNKGLPKSSPMGDILGDLYETYPERYNLYLQILLSLSSSNPKAVDALLSKENATRYQRDRVNKYLKKIQSYFSKNRGKYNELLQVIEGTGDQRTIKEVYKNTPLAKLQELLTMNNDKLNKEVGNDILKEIKIIKKLSETATPTQEDMIEGLNKMLERKSALLELRKINERLQNNILTTNNQVELKGVQTESNNIPATELLKVREGGGSKFDEYKKQLNLDDDVFSKTSTDEYTVDPTKISESIKEKYLEDPRFSPNVENVVMTDRIIFIVATFIIRAIALFMVEWGVHTNFINTFVKGFSLFFGVYVCIFLLVYILTNAKEDEYLFRMLFFYMNTQSENGKGVIRVIVHLLCILMLLPIPFIVRDFREFEKITMTFSEKRTLLNGVSQFTLYMWILTSVVALKV